MNHRARKLRQSASDAEARLWQQLRNRNLRGYKFRRQMKIGPYFADFVCVKAKLIIEADGGQHLEQIDYDNRRTCFLEKQGFRVLRYWNDEILCDMDGVLEDVLWHLEHSPSP